MEMSHADSVKLAQLNLALQRATMEYFVWPRPEGWDSKVRWQALSDAAVALNRFIRSLM